MINEGQVTLLWERLFQQETITPEGLQRADELLEQLRPESPLRFRLEKELSEIRQLQQPESSRPKKRKAQAARK
jgi:hypothetical protein